MAQWQGMFSGNTHGSKVADIEDSLRLAVTSFRGSSEPERRNHTKAVSQLAHRLYKARLKALEALISLDSEPRPGRTPGAGLLLHRRKLSKLETLGIGGILDEFGVGELKPE